MKRIKINKLPEHLDEAHLYVMDDNHFYALEQLGKDGVEPSKLLIHFIKGGRNTDKCKPGIVDAQLIEMVLHRTMVFKDKFQSTDSDELIYHLSKALEECNKRTISRHEKGVLGNNGEDYGKPTN